MKELINEFKRHKMFFLTELIVFILIAIIVGIKLDAFPYLFYVITNNYEKVRGMHFEGTSYRIYRVLDQLGLIGLIAVPTTVFICTGLRYLIFDNRKQKLFKSSVPVKYQTETWFEVLSGIIPIFVMTFIYGIIQSLTFDWAVSGPLVLSGFNLTGLRYIFFESYEYEFFLIIIWYLALVLAKRVSASAGGIITAFGLNFFLVVLAESIYLDINIPVTSLVVYIPFIILYSVLLFIFDRKLDISKGGTFYFKSVSVAMTILSGIAFCVMTLSLFYTEKGQINASYIILSILMGLIVMPAEYFLTRPKIKS